MGRGNWWAPAPLRTFWLRFGLREAAEDPPADEPRNEPRRASEPPELVRLLDDQVIDLRDPVSTIP
jgi:hypothetical protein